MTRTLDVTGWFDEAAFSDIIVKFVSKQRRCHKVILCKNSKYFMGLCGPGKSFAEAQQPVIELEEDDEEALQAMLRWIYTFDYEEPNSFSSFRTPAAIKLHLSVCVVADKYMIDDLKNEALTRLRKRLEAVDEAELTRIIIKVHDKKATYPQSILDMTDEVRDNRRMALVANPEFRALLASDAELCLEMMDKVVAGKVAAKGDDAYQEMSFFECKTCHRQELLAASFKARYCSNSRCFGKPAPVHQRVWVLKTPSNDTKSPVYSTNRFDTMANSTEEELGFDTDESEEEE